MTADDYRTIATVCGFVLLLVGFYLAAAPVGVCSECDHCRRERLALEARYAICPICMKRHKPSDPHL